MSAERGWIGQPQPSRTYAPGEERKWRIMMGNGQFLTDAANQRLAREHIAEIQAEDPGDE